MRVLFLSSKRTAYKMKFDWLYRCKPVHPKGDQSWVFTGRTDAETERHLLLGRRTRTNLDSILKNRDITWLTKVHLVKAMVFPVVMYGCESWTVKKAEHLRLMLLNCGVGEDS